MDIVVYDTGNNQVILSLEVQSNTHALDDLVDRASDTKMLQKRIGWLIRRAFATRFAEGGPGWKPLEMSTVMSKMEAELPPVGKSGKVYPRLRQIGVAPAASVLIAGGNLRDSYVRRWHPDHVSRVEETDEGIKVIEGSKDPKAEFHQKGTSPYTITATNAKSLRFINGGGSVVFRQSVSHPGLPARPVEITTVEETQITEAVKEHYRGLGIHHE